VKLGEEAAIKELIGKKYLLGGKKSKVIGWAAEADGTPVMTYGRDPDIYKPVKFMPIDHSINLTAQLEGLDLT
jgi:hypothetical protein